MCEKMRCGRLGNVKQRYLSRFSPCSAWPSCEDMSHALSSRPWHRRSVLLAETYPPSPRSQPKCHLLREPFSCYPFLHSLVAQRVEHLPAMRETWVGSLGWENPLEKEMATHSSILAWKMPCMEKPGRLQSMGSQRVRHDLVTSLYQ